ncbi:MAG TPA: META domain-containing protein, partial [Terriglobales bacterium]|nr:META domain-containing protein [Terriglobales bacterium]
MNRISAILALAGALFFAGSPQLFAQSTADKPAAAPQSELKGRALRTSPQYLVEHGGWTLIRLGDDAVPTGPHDPEPNIEFNSKEHRVGDSGGCNRLMGTYEIDGQSIRFSKMATTRMACEKGMDLE